MSRPGQQPPISYRTVPGRHRTQKWQAAAKYNYDGDDWGGYDPYDEYEGEYGEEQPPPGNSQQHLAGRPPRRVNSFDQGDEGRMFATATAAPGPSSTAPFPPYDPRFASPPGQGYRQPSNDDIGAQGRQRDFSNPDHVPPPLNTRPSPGAGERFPPRKSSLNGNSPADNPPMPVIPPTSSTAEPSEKPLPFIRPSDIYKRIPEERERERRSEDSSRPSMDSVQREAESGITAGPRTNLATVAESRESRLFMDEPGQLQSPTNDLQHRPSHGFKSAVQKAFDSADADSSARDDSSTSDTVGRSNTTSTSAISPITSHVPAPTLSEQVMPIEDRNSAYPQHPTSQPPILAAVEPGYRRSLEPPLSEQSAARHPAVEDASTSRLSFPMMAETVPAQSPAVPDQAAEVPNPILHPVEIPPTDSIRTTTGPQTITGRGRSGTDYSIREADLANTVNATPPDDEVLAETVAEAKANQELFLSTHTTTPITPLNSSAADALGASRTGTPTNMGPNSPSKGRVREIAGQYQEIHNASRRGSEASIGSNKSRKDTASHFPGSVDADSTVPPLSATRPVIDREQSFVPHLPGGWVSSAPTPTAELEGFEDEEDAHISPPTPRAQEPIDLTPTTKKVPLQEVHSTTMQPQFDGSPAPFDAVKNAGDELGAALMASVGMGHQTRDFASAGAAEPVHQPEKNSSTRSGPVTAPALLWRQNTHNSDAPTSVASSKPPTPLPKDTPKDGVYNSTPTASDHLSSNYFSSAVPPLRLSSKQPSSEPVDRTVEQPPTLTASTLSTATGSDDTESDRLRMEIVRSLEATDQPLDASKRNSRIEQDASQVPPMETASRPDFLQQRFSWETPLPPQDPPANVARPPIPVIAKAPEPESPEIKPERAYERPRSSVLHVMNADLTDASPTESIPELRIPEITESFQPIEDEPASVDVLTDHSNLHPDLAQYGNESRPQSSSELAPASASDRALSVDSGPRLPSYYLGNNHSDTYVEAFEKDTASPPYSPEAAADQSPKPKTGPIPQFRNILAIKSTDERIRTYDQTRQTFAEMNTGLSDWLTHMLDTYPEHADVAAGKLQTSTTGTFKRGHKASPSMLKFSKQLGDNQRSTSGSGPAEDVVAASQRRSSIPGNERMDMDKMSQRGKEFMKSAGVLGGKAQAGAKGLFAKGKSRFGTRRDSDKALFASSTASADVFSSPLPPPDLPTSNNPTSLRGGAATPPPSSTPPPKAQPSDSYLTLRPSLSLSSQSRNSSASPEIASSSRPRTHFSQTLSLFRSSSRSKSKSKSPAPSGSHLSPNVRPTSLVLPKPDPVMLQKGFDISSPVEESEFRHTEIPPTIDEIPGRSLTLGSRGKSRKEIWEDQSDGGSRRGSSRGGGLAMPGPENFDNIEDRRRHLERLGVLPSPAETMRTFDFGPAGASPTSTRRSKDGGGGDGEVPPSPIASRRERKGSDIASLPSQIRRKSVASSSFSGRDRAIDEESQEMVLQANPITLKPAQPVVVTNAMHTQKNEGKDDDEDLYGVTPMTPKATAGFEKLQTIESEGVKSDKDIDGGVEQLMEGVKDSPKAVVPRPTEGDSMVGNDATSESKDEPTLEQIPPDAATPKPNFAVLQRAETRDDNLSEISAEDDVPAEEPRRDSAVSRRSSVSSLGGPDTAAATPGFRFETRDSMDELPIMSAQAVPAGPIGPPTPSSPVNAGLSPHLNDRQTASREALEYRERFANRPYRAASSEERPLSYDPLERDSSGALIQETLPSSGRAVEVNRNARPGNAPSQFHPHPAVRTGVQPTDYERLRTSVPQPIEPDIIRQPQSNDNTKVKKSKQFTLIPRKNKQSELEAGSGSTAPPLRSPEPSSARPNARPQTEEKQGRRRSLVLDSIIGRRPSVAERGQLSNASSVADMRPGSNAGPPVTSDKASDNSEALKSRPNTLRKPQRSASITSSSEAEPKKKRFSGLGMLFGRSSTTGHANATKPSRLSKAPPPMKQSNSSQETQTQRMTQPTGESSNTVSGNVRNYEEFEELRRRDMPAFQENSTRLLAGEVVRPPSARREPKLPNLQTMPEEGAAPRDWHGTNDINEASFPRGPLSAPAGSPPMEYRRMQNDNNRVAIPSSGIPEISRQTQATYGGTAQPIRPYSGPPQQEYQGSRGGLPYSPGQPRSPFYDGAPPVNLGNTPRQPSYGSEVSQLSRHLSGNSDMRAASVSPLQARDGNEGYALPRENRPVSTGHSFSQGSRGEFYEQPPPSWGPRRPQEGNRPPRPAREPPGTAPAFPLQQQQQQQQQWYPRRDDRSFLYEEQYGSRYSYPEPGPQRPPVYGSPHHSLPNPVGYPPGAQFSQRPPIPPIPQQYQHEAYRDDGNPAYGTQPPPQFYQQRGPQFRQGAPPHTSPSYNSPPPPFFNRKSMPRPSTYNTGGPPDVRQQQMYNDDGFGSRYPPPRQQMQQQQQQHRRASGGPERYSGRRDDPTAREDEEMQMRGASYPGQEWTPEGLHGDWD